MSPSPLSRPGSPGWKKRSVPGCSTAVGALFLRSQGIVWRRMPAPWSRPGSSHVPNHGRRAGAGCLRVAIVSTLPVPAALAWLASAQQRAGLRGRSLRGYSRRRCRSLAARPLRHRPLPRRASRSRRTNAASLWRETLCAGRCHRPPRGDTRTAGRSRNWPTRLSCCARPARPMTMPSACSPPKGVRPRAVLSSADEERCAAAVAVGLGVSLMPRSLLRPGLVTAEIREVALERRVVLAWRADADDELVQMLRDSALAHPWPGTAQRQCPPGLRSMTGDHPSNASPRRRANARKS
jgi:hypothetical protein